MTTVELVIEPDPDVPTCATVLVDALVDGARHRFVVDTGAGRTTLLSGALTQCLTPSGRHTSAGLFGTTTDLLVTVGDLQLGELPGRRLEVLVTEPADGARDLLGMDVLGAHRCHFRFLDDPPVLQLSATTTSPLAGEEELVLGPHGQPFVRLSWPDGTSARAMWDSGAAITVVDTAFHARHPQLFGAVGDVVATDSTGTQRSTPTCHVAAVRAGGVTLDRHVAAITDLSPTRAAGQPPTDLVLGHPALRQASWVLDVPARRWSVTRDRPG